MLQMYQDREMCGKKLLRDNDIKSFQFISEYLIVEEEIIISPSLQTVVRARHLAQKAIAMKGMVTNPWEYETVMTRPENSRFRSMFVRADSDGAKHLVIKANMPTNGNWSIRTGYIQRLQILMKLKSTSTL
jgi:hypothetical protein